MDSSPELRAFSLSVDAEGDGEYVYLEPWLELTVVPTDNHMIHIGGRAQAVVGEKYRLTVGVIDEHANPITDYTGALDV